VGGIPPRPSRSEAPPPRALSAEAEAEKFSFPFRRKNRRAQNKKCRENFFAGWRMVASGGGLASLVSFKVGSRKAYNYSTKVKNRELPRFFGYESN